MDRGNLAAHLRRARERAALGGARGLSLAPLPEKKNQQLLARGLHAILAEREPRRRLALAQQADAIAQAFRELARVEIARLGRRGRRRIEPLGDALARQVGGERQDACLFGDRLGRHLELCRPALEEESGEGELALGELV